MSVCNKCKKRDLALLANEVFKDKRVAKQWLSKKDHHGPLGRSPIERIVDKYSDADDIIMSLYIAAALDKDQFDRETYEERFKRIVETTLLMGMYRNKEHAEAVIKNDYMLGEREKMSDMLKTREGSRRVQDRLARIYYGVYT